MNYVATTYTRSSEGYLAPCKPLGIVPVLKANQSVELRHLKWRRRALELFAVGDHHITDVIPALRAGNACCGASDRTPRLE